MSHDDNGGMLRLPNPHDPNSGYVDHAPGYAIGSAPAPAPEGMVFVPGLNTYVDHDIAAQLGLSAPQGAPQDAAAESLSLRPEAIPEELGREIDPEELEISDEELEALADELETQSDRVPSLSPTLDDIANVFGDGFDAAIDRLVVGTNEDALSEFVEATGLDERSAATLIEATVMEAGPVAAEHIGDDRWASIVYAAAATPDPFAKRVVADFVQGKLHPSKLMGAYALWYDSLPDGED